MEWLEFKDKYITENLGIDKEFGEILSFIDFGNVNYWFSEDTQDNDNNPLKDDQRIGISVEKLKDFCSIFSKDIRFYYGHDQGNESSIRFIVANRYIFGKPRVFTKRIQKVRHYLTDEEIQSNTRNVFSDKRGKYVFLPKCNFDVEITVDAIRLMKSYNTIALFSGDADFVSLLTFLKNNEKKIILFKHGNITNDLRRISDKVISAQDIKNYITRIEKQKPGV